MNYELAKELKEAGFPQQPFWQVDVNAWGGSWYMLYIPDACPAIAFMDLDQCNDFLKSPACAGRDLVKLPTLEELIEACGMERTFNGSPHFFRLEYNRDRHGVKWWGGFVDDLESELHAIRQCGATPEEAVARLWLALNKK